MYCSSCGSRLVPGEAFCRTCGMPVRAEFAVLSRREASLRSFAAMDAAGQPVRAASQPAARQYAAPQAAQVPQTSQIPQVPQVPQTPAPAPRPTESVPLRIDPPSGRTGPSRTAPRPTRSRPTGTLRASLILLSLLTLLLLLVPIRADNYYTWITALSAALLAGLCLAGAPVDGPGFAAVLTLFALRFLILDLRRVLGLANWAITLGLVIGRLSLYLLAVLAWLFTADDGKKRNGLEVGFVLLSLIHILYVLTKVAEDARAIGSRDFASSICFHLGWILFVAVCALGHYASRGSRNVPAAGQGGGETAAGWEAPQTGAREAQPAPFEAAAYEGPAPQPVYASAPPAEGLLGLGEYFIDEKVTAFRFTNAYQIYDAQGRPAGAVRQADISGGAKAARLLLGSRTKGLQSFRFDLLDADGSELASVRRGGMGEGLAALRQIGIFDAWDQQLGGIQMIPHFASTEQRVTDAAGRPVCSITGDWKGWNFRITAPDGRLLGAIDKQWGGLARELFTTADKYHVSLSPYTDPGERLLITAAAITIDMILHEMA